MSRINYSRNAARTDCNYSFCEEKENLSPTTLQELTCLLNHHYQLHLKNAQTIRQQAQQIHHMHAAILSIQQQLPHSIHQLPNQARARVAVEGRPSLGQQPSISSISKRSHCHQSIDTFSLAQRTVRTSLSKASSKRSKGVRCSSGKTGKQGSGKSRESNHKTSKESSCDSDGDAKLLSTIVERRLNIEKQLKQRLQRHAQGEGHGGLGLGYGGLGLGVR